MAASVMNENPLYKPFDSTSKDVYTNENIVYGSHQDIYQDICVLKSLNKAKFPVYLVCSRVNKQNYAMKVFPHKNGQLHSYYKNEIRFASLQHPNVIRNLYFENEKDTLSKGVVTKVSYTMMEYAPYGDFFDFVMKQGKNMDEKLARTYFRQLIDGVEYLHKNGVSHMDIKLENLLVSKDYTLKIADFDLSFFESDSKIISKGTRFYRAPEVLQAACKDTKAADIYSAGVVLFTFKTRGMLPHSENNLVAGTNFCELLHNNDPKFWMKHTEIQRREKNFFDDDFKELFMSMTKANPDERATIKTIKKSKWYNGPVYSNEELKAQMKNLFGY